MPEITKEEIARLRDIAEKSNPTWEFAEPNITGSCAWACCVHVRAASPSIVLRLLDRIEELERDLQAMTEDRNLWKYAHNDDCPNINMVDTLTEQLATAKAEARREALEEAAKHIEDASAYSGYEDIAKVHAKFIRALAQEKKDQ